MRMMLKADGDDNKDSEKILIYVFYILGFEWLNNYNFVDSINKCVFLDK